VKAARIHEFGSPEVIRIDDVPQPTPNEGQILVRVAAAGFSLIAGAGVGRYELVRT